ncbi:MAG: hypothetical protein CMI18_01545 [Opitutaceae bacterium]|nr:hypothetical protein [Opitutaceae bacterium]
MFYSWASFVNNTVMKALLSVALLLAFCAHAWSKDFMVEYHERRGWLKSATPKQIADLRKTTEKGDPETQFTLGLAYAIGLGVPEDVKKAVKWYRIAAKQEDRWAQYYLGVMYDNGNGVPEYDKEAVKWYRKAAEQGHVLAQYYLGVMYEKGDGIIEDKVQAYVWWNIAQANEDEDAKKKKAILGEMMNKEQIAKAQDLSAEMLKANPKLMGD